MPKIDVNRVAEILKKNHLDPALLRRVVEEMNLAVQPDPGSGDSAPAVDKQFVVIVSDPNGVYGDRDLVAWVVQIPETESPASTLGRLFRGAYDYNASKKGRLYPAKTIGDAIENIPARFFKEADLWVKTKTPVLIIRSDNQIPRS